MIEENSGPAKSVPLSEVSHLLSVPLREVLLYLDPPIHPASLMVRLQKKSEDKIPRHYVCDRIYTHKEA